jgi:transcription antitermination factor NusG
MTMVDMRPKLGEIAAADATRRAREAAERRGHPSHLAWYVTRTRAGDNRAFGWLRHFGFEFYYPHELTARPIPRKRLSHKQRRAVFVPTEMVREPLFPGYIFVHFDPSTGGWHEQFETAGLVGMLCYGNIPAPISNELINRLRGKEIEGAIPYETPVRYVLPVGEVVRITEGPFRAFRGTVERGIDTPIGELTTDAKIRVLAMLFGRECPVELEIRQIERL